MRTPLTIVQEYVSLVLDGQAGLVTSEQAECLNVALRNCRRLTTLLNDLLEMSQLNSSKIELAPEVTDLGPLLNGCFNEFSEICLAKNLTLTAGTFGGMPPVFCDAERIRQVLANLIGNSVKLRPPAV